jgi:predicted regulator of Ras-like GTPase activity (Roadblock/LC7/MglB family)
MSAHATNSKPGFSGFLRRLLGRTDHQADAENSAEGVNEVTNYYNYQPGAVTDPGGKFVNVPLKAVIAALPLDLRTKVKKSVLGDVTIPVQQAKILGQLASGAVRITFGEIRAAAPAMFLGGGDADKAIVTLPLGEILPRLNPALLARRPTQRHVEVATEITSPFDDPTQALVFSLGNEPMAPAVPVAPAPVVTHQSPGITFKPIARTPVPLAASPAPAPAPLMPTPAPTEPFVGAPVGRGARPIVVRMTHPPKNQPNSSAILVPLASLAESWPEVVREEIVQQGLAEARLSLPAELMEISLKRGRVVFPWKVIRTWVRPALQSYLSLHDSMELELPLKAVAPLFLQKRSNGDRVQQRPDIDESIPNLFFGFPKPENSPAVPAPDTNYYVWSDTQDVAQVEDQVFKRKPVTGGTEFVAKYATPNEIVSRAAALDGVAGAVIALPDGLMVASQIPSEQNGETLAAFLPQIFARVSQSTKELRMGDLNNLSFTVGNVPWKIFRVNAIFFAAFGREGQSLPSGQLAGLAAELDRKNK